MTTIKQWSEDIVGELVFHGHFQSVLVSTLCAKCQFTNNILIWFINEPMHNTSKIKKVIPRHHLYASHLRTKAKRSKDVNGISSGYQLSTYDILGDHSKSGAKKSVARVRRRGHWEPSLPLLHSLSLLPVPLMANVPNAFLCWFTVEFWVQVRSLLFDRLFDFHLEGVRFCPRVLADTCHQPRNL